MTKTGAVDVEFELPRSVDVHLPPEYRQALKRLVETDKTPADIVFIHGALWSMRGSEMTIQERQAELTALIREGIDSGDEGVEMTPDYLEQLEQHTTAWLAWLKTQEVANTLLPDELHAYVEHMVTSGRYSDPTAVVCAALERLSEFQQALDQE